MANTLYKITTSEPILPQINETKNLSLYTKLKQSYRKMNRFFGIEESTKDQKWYYGTLLVMMFIPLCTLLFGDMLARF